MDWSCACFSDSDGGGGFELEGVEEALTNLEKKEEEEEEEGRAEPGFGTSSFGAEEENPRPCLNLAAPSPFRVSSS